MDIQQLLENAKEHLSTHLRQKQFLVDSFYIVYNTIDKKFYAGILITKGCRTFECSFIIENFLNAYYSMNIESVQWYGDKERFYHFDSSYKVIGHCIL